MVCVTPQEFIMWNRMPLDFERNVCFQFLWNVRQRGSLINAQTFKEMENNRGIQQ
jgi:hypothetical protein